MRLEEAYAAVRRGEPVLVERTGRGLVRLTGPQRIWFLQNTVSNDVESVLPGSWVASCFLDTKGKVLARFRVGVLQDDVVLDVDPPGTDTLVDWFLRYKFRTKVDVEDLTRALRCFTVIGGSAEDGSVRRSETDVVFEGTVGEVAVTDVFAAGLPARLEGFPSAGEDLYDVLRVEAGLGRFGADFGPDTLPQEAGLTPIVSVTKGCYVGQEVMARLHFRGHVNRSLRPLAFAGSSDAGGLVGSELRREGERVGRVTSAVVSPGRGAIGIGMVRVTISDGEALEVVGDGQARVGSLPPGTKAR